MKSRLSIEDFLLIFLSMVPMEERIRCKVVDILKKGASFDWYSIVRKAFVNEVYPQLYYNLRSLSSEERISIPERAMKTLEASYYISVARSMVCHGILKCVLETCDDAEIDVLPFKGIVLAEKLYPRRHLRVMSDIDLLIPEIDQNREVYDSLRRKLLVLREKYGAVYVKVHLHSTWRRAMGFWRSKSETERIWGRAVETEIGEVKVPVMSLEDILLMSCYHSFGHSRLNLRDLCDLFVILKLYSADLDWEYIFDTAKRTGLAVPLYCPLYLINHLFDVKELPRDTLKKLEKMWEVKLFRFFLPTWSLQGGIFESISKIYREICRVRSFGVLYVMDFYLRNRREAVRDSIGIITGLLMRSRVQEPACRADTGQNGVTL